jgi:hypothetical protein
VGGGKPPFIPRQPCGFAAENPKPQIPKAKQMTKGRSGRTCWRILWSLAFGIWRLCNFAMDDPRLDKFPFVPSSRLR